MSPGAGKQKKAEDKEFEETFKPKKGNIPEKLEDDKKGKKKKKKPGFIKILIIIGIIIILLGGAVTALYFSGILTPLLDMAGIHLQLPTNPGPSIAEQQAALDQRKTELDAREEELNKLKDKLDAQQTALDAAAEASAAAAATLEGILSGYSEQKLAELKQVGSIYTKMDPAAAATIMTRIYDSKQLAVIIYYMQPAASALVMEKLDPGLAADITSILTS